MSQQGQLRKLVVAVDASPNAARAGNEAVMLAEKFNAELIALHAVPIPSYTFAQAEVGSVAPSMFQEYYEAAQKEGKLAVDEVVTLAKAKNVKATGVVLGPAVSVVETIIEYAAKNDVSNSSWYAGTYGIQEASSRQCLHWCSCTCRLLSAGCTIIRRRAGQEQEH